MHTGYLNSLNWLFKLSRTRTTQYAANWVVNNCKSNISTPSLKHAATFTFKITSANVRPSQFFLLNSEMNCRRTGMIPPICSRTTVKKIDTKVSYRKQIAHQHSCHKNFGLGWGVVKSEKNRLPFVSVYVGNCVRWGSAWPFRNTPLLTYAHVSNLVALGRTVYRRI